MLPEVMRRASVAAAAVATVPAGLSSAETADEFVARINREFADIWLEGNAAWWKLREQNKGQQCGW